MSNLNIRDLKIFEFNRTLSYVSEILENLRKKELLTKERTNLLDEKDEWEDELAFLPKNKKKEEKETISEFILNINSRINEIDKELRHLGLYVNELKILVSNNLEYILNEENLALEREEIKQSFLEEYIYILTDIPINDGDYIAVEEIFCEKGDLVILICKTYGDDQKQLICNIIHTEDCIDGMFEQYFNLN